MVLLSMKHGVRMPRKGMTGIPTLCAAALAMGEMIWLARTLTSIFGYAIRPVILILFIRLISPEKPLGWAWVLAGVNAAVHTTALFSRICF